MLVSYNWLNKYFDSKLPSPEEVAEALTFHAWEIDEVKSVGSDTVLDIKVLPDKAMWGLSHRGIAKDISTILNLPLKLDPLLSPIELTPQSDAVKIKIESPICKRFAGALIKGAKVGESPKWLKDSLEAINQRSINNIVDASNYVMFDLGQPSHAFDAKVVGDGILVRQANAGETLEALDENEYTFTEDDTLISSQTDERALSIAGIKGGEESGITDTTTDIFIEVANWDPVAVRKTANRLKLRSDASSRYENGIVPEMVPYGLKAVVDLIIEVAGGELIGYGEHQGEIKSRSPVSVTLNKLNSVLGINLKNDEVTAILDRFGFAYEVKNDEFVVTPPFERTDMVIAEDLIEEIGRIYGYQHITAIAPEPIPVTEINARFYYSEIVRNTLMDLGFSEIYTSSFRDTDEVKLANALATDKGYLRSTLMSNMQDSLQKNTANTDVLGLKQIKLFEIGTVFNNAAEKITLCFGVMSPSGYKAKLDNPAVEEAVQGLTTSLGVQIDGTTQDGVIEIDFTEIVDKLPKPDAYKKISFSEASYLPFSNYPAIVRDIAMWVPENTNENEVEQLINDSAGPLRLRTTLFDTWTKDGKTSYAFRLVFQSEKTTLTDSEINSVMDGVYQAISKRGFEVR